MISPLSLVGANGPGGLFLAKLDLRTISKICKKGSRNRPRVLRGSPWPLAAHFLPCVVRCLTFDGPLFDCSVCQNALCSGPSQNFVLWVFVNQKSGKGQEGCKHVAKRAASSWDDARCMFGLCWNPRLEPFSPFFSEGPTFQENPPRPLVEHLPGSRKILSNNVCFTDFSGTAPSPYKAKQHLTKHVSLQNGGTSTFRLGKFRLGSSKFRK